MPTTVLVAGATGNLGSKIVTELSDRGATVRALVRPEKADGGDGLRDLVSAQRIDVVLGDLATDRAVLAGYLEGVDIVISAVQGGPQVIIDGQTNLLRAAEDAGVPRMVPSDFSVDLHRLDYGDNVNLDLRKKFDEAFDDSPVRPTFLLNGGFMEVMLAPFMGILDRESNTFSYWGDGEQPMDFTTIPDTAAYTAEAALDPTAADRTVAVAGAVLTMKQLHAEIERATGTALAMIHRGDIAALEAEIDRRKATATNPFDYISLQYQWAMVTGKGKLHDLANDRHPAITPVTVAQFLREL